MKDVYKINKGFLKSKGLELKPTGCWGTPYELENDEYLLSLSEWQDLFIRNKRTGGCHSVNLVTNLLDNNDFK